MPRTVTQRTSIRPKPEMSLVGYLVAAGTLLVLLPILPFLAVLWIADRLRGGGDQQLPADIGESESERGSEAGEDRAPTP